MAFGTTTVSSLFTAPADQAAPPNFNYSFSGKNLFSKEASGEAVKKGYRTFSSGDRMETHPGEESLLFVLWPYVLPRPFSLPPPTLGSIGGAAFFQPNDLEQVIATCWTSNHLVVNELTGVTGENNAWSSIPVDCRTPKRSHVRKLLYL